MEARFRAARQGANGDGRVERARSVQRAVGLEADRALVEQAVENWAAIGAWALHGDHFVFQPWAARAD
eukprot:2946523-Lingulodinium_polyedra.AAC.1